MNYTIIKFICIYIWICIGFGLNVKAIGNFECDNMEWHDYATFILDLIILIYFTVLGFFH